MNRVLCAAASNSRQLMRLSPVGARQLPRMFSLCNFQAGRNNLPVMRDPFSSFSPVSNIFRAMEHQMRDFEDAFFRNLPRRMFDHPGKEVLEDFPEVKYTTKDFTVKVNVSKFVNGDLKCELVDNNILSIKGTHEVKTGEHGYSKQEMTREFRLPDDVDRESLSTTLGDNGILTITARIKGAANNEQRKTIKIEKCQKTPISGSTQSTPPAEGGNKSD